MIFPENFKIHRAACRQCPWVDYGENLPQKAQAHADMTRHSVAVGGAFTAEIRHDQGAANLRDQMKGAPSS